jgi:L-fuconolactonase
MKLIDAHQHYWRLDRGDYAWLTPRLGALYRHFEPGDLADQLAHCNVASTVLVQAAATEAETRYLIGLARQHDSVAGVVGWVDFEADDSARRIARLVKEGAGVLKGFRPMIQDIADLKWLSKPALDGAFEALVAADLTFDALVTPRHLELLRHRLLKHPRLRAVLDHAGKPDIAGGVRGPTFEAWASELERLGRETSICCKLSGLLTEAAPGSDGGVLDPFVAHIFACFGPERVFWGSDWPVLTLCCSYEEWLDMAMTLVRRHEPGAEQAVFESNARRFYGLQGEGCVADHGA